MNSITLSQQTVTLVPGSTATLVATPRDASGLAVTRTVTWTSTDNSRATISTAGIVTGMSAGTTTIQAESEGKTAQALITVKDGGSIGPAGGLVTALSGKVDLTVAAGAVLAPVMITVEGAPSPPADARLVGNTAIELGPSGQTFNASVQLRIRYETSQLPPGASEALLRIHRAVAGVWELVPGGQADPATRTVMATLSSFSTYAILATEPPPAIALSSSSLTFAANATGPNPASQGVTITNSGGGALTGLAVGSISYGPGATGWLQAPSLNVTSATPSAVLTVQPVTGSLGTGTYTATIAVQSPVAANSPRTISVTFNVGAPVTPPQISLGPTSLTFNATQNGANPASKFTTITNTGGGTLMGLTVGTVTYGPGATGWLQAPTLSSSSANPSATLTLQPVTGALQPGTYSATIPVQSAVASNSPQLLTASLVVAAAAPDLLVDVVTVPASGTIGSTISGSATVRSSGGAISSAFRVSYYISSDATITTSDVFTGSGCTFNSGLTANTTVDCTGAINVPGSLAAGVYFVGAIVDDLSQVNESDETNNARAATQPIQLSLPVNLPDLTVDVVTVPSTGVVGGTINGSATLRNLGTSTTSSFRVAFYYSTDANVSTADVFAGSGCTYNSGLAAGATADCSGAITVPVSLAPGTYFVGAIVDDVAQITESNETNNARASVTTTLLSAPVAAADLLVDAVTAPASGSVGLQITVSATVRNGGTVATGAFRLGFYISADQTITTDDRFFGSCNYSSGLNAGAPSTCSGPITVPTLVTPGTYYVGVIADDQGTVSESNETNNSRAAANATVLTSGPDFIITAVSAPSLAIIGSTINVTATVRNQGNLSNTPFRVGIYYSTDAIITTADVFSGTGCMYPTGLGPNTSNDCTGPVNVPADLPPGTYFVGAIADDQLAVTEANETNNARASATTTSVLVTAPAPNLVIDGMYLVQATQSYTGGVPIVAGRDGLLRVFVRASQANNLTPAVRVRFYASGVLVDTRTLSAGGVEVPMAITEGVLTSSWNTTVAAALIQPGLSILADVDPANAIAETSEADNSFPVNGSPLGLDVRTMPPLNITLVPISQTSNGLTGNVTAGNQNSFLTKTKRFWPVATVNSVVHATYTTSLEPLQSDGSNWSALLSELNALRMAEGSTREYYGVAKVSYNSGVAGLGYIGVPASFGWDYLPSGDGVMAHELGHNFGRLHSPCGGPSGVDPAYPYPLAAIGAFGFDLTTGLVQQNTMPDVMSYCSPEWVSDYTYKGAMTFMTNNPTGSLVSQAVDGVLIWGRIDNGQLVLEPAVDVFAPPTRVRASGPYRIDATDASGRSLMSFGFAPDSVADMPSASLHFAFVIPKSAFGTTPLSQLVLRAPTGATAAVRGSAAALQIGPAQLPTASRRGAAAMAVTWDARRYPLAVVRSVTTGEILSFARGGSAAVRSGAGEVDVVLSDGIQSTIRRVRVNP